MPSNGYEHFFQKLLNHSGIQVRLDTDAGKLLKIEAGRVYYQGEQIGKPVFYTGAIDELLNYKYGVLPYRSLRFVWQTAEVDSVQNAPVTAYPQAPDYTRIVEYKKLPPQEIPGFTTYATEYPLVSDREQEPYYPIPNVANTAKYQQYRTELQSVPDLYLCGRLAEYQYFNMDQTVRSALNLYQRFVTK
jgi:UDP-galactopyranose mutase